METATGIEGDRKGDTNGETKDKRQEKKEEKKGTRTRTRTGTSYLLWMVCRVLEVPISDGF
jgi:hypothetical protein